jgi:hypothetical protein
MTKKAFLVFSAVILLVSVALVLCGCERPEGGNDAERPDGPPGGPLLLIGVLVLIGVVVAVGIWWWRRRKE